MATTTQAVSIPATHTHQAGTCPARRMTVREYRLRQLESLMIRRERSYECTYTQGRALEQRLERVFGEITELMLARACTCESFT